MPDGYTLPPWFDPQGTGLDDDSPLANSTRHIFNMLSQNPAAGYGEQDRNHAFGMMSQAKSRMNPLIAAMQQQATGLQERGDTMFEQGQGFLDPNSSVNRTAMNRSMEGAMDMGAMQTRMNNQQNARFGGAGAIGRQQGRAIFSQATQQGLQGGREAVRGNQNTGLGLTGQAGNLFGQAAQARQGAGQLGLGLGSELSGLFGLGAQAGQYSSDMYQSWLDAAASHYGANV